MLKLVTCFATAADANSGVRKAPKFPPKKVKKAVKAEATAKDTLKRYPRIMAELAK